MKFLLKFSLLLSLATLSFSCSLKEKGKAQKAATKEWMSPNGNVKVLATTGMVADLVKEIGKEYVDSYTLIKGDLDPHSYQLVKGDDEKLSYADIIFYSGLGLEHGPSLHHYLSDNPKSYAVANYIAKLRPTDLLYYNNMVDPHIWMDISLWKFAIPYVIQVLSEKDPVHAESYRKQGQELYARYDEADKEVRAILAKLPEEKRFLVTSHDAFNYFTRRYLATDKEQEEGGWQKRFAAPEGLSPDSQLSSHEIQGIIEHLKQYHITTLFPESNLSKDSIKKIIDSGKEHGLHLKMNAEPLYGDAMGPVGSLAETYIGMLRQNAKIIYDNLK